MTLLSAILEAKHAELPRLRAEALPSPPPRREVLLKRGPAEPLRLIAEFKRRSPSAGELSGKLSLTERAVIYERAGASMISVLCDRQFFGGSYADLARAREATALPLLCKEFVVDEAQLEAARCYGADAVLLIVRCLGPERLARLVTEAQARELVPIVEVMDEREARLAIAASAPVVGVNARDLDTLAMDPTRAQRVLAELPSSVVRLHFSGIKSPAMVAELVQAGVDGALVGEALMREDDPGPLLERLVANARN